MELAKQKKEDWMEELKNKLIKKVPEKFWLRFVKKCKKRKVTVLQGFIEATSKWMEEDAL